MSDDVQQALAQVLEALAAGPTPGPWVTMPANAGVHCVARINAWEAVPPSDCELSHDSIDASFIAACSPANMTAILAHVQAQEAEIERLRAALNTCAWALRQPLDEWKGGCERKALDEARDALKEQR